MAGTGTRTSDVYSTPKPLIMVKGKPLFAWALDGLPLDLACEITIITNKRVSKDPSFDRCLESFVPKSIKLNVEVLQNATSGQAETVLLGTKKVENHRGLLIFNCDTFISDEFPRDFEKWDGILGTFRSSNPAMSYVETNGNIVTRTVEKELISTQASTGLYYFASKEIFQNAYDDTNHLKESYVAPMYNSMIQKGLEVGFFGTDTVVPLGTSQEIETFKHSRLSMEKR